MAFKFGIPQDNTQTSAKEVRDNFESLATTNITADSSLPRNPRNGMLRILTLDESNILIQVYWNSWMTVLSNIGAGASTQRKEQSFISSTEWIFEHNLNCIPIVQVIDETGHVVIPEDIQFSGLNRVIVRHTTAIAGKIIVVG